MKLSKKNKRRYASNLFTYKELVKKTCPRYRNVLIRCLFEPPRKPIKPHIKNTAWGGRESIFFVFDIKWVLGCKRRVVTFGREGEKERFTQKGNQVRLK